MAKRAAKVFIAGSWRWRFGILFVVFGAFVRGVVARVVLVYRFGEVPDPQFANKEHNEYRCISVCPLALP